MPESRLLCIGNVTIDEAIQPDGAHSESLGGDALFAALAARLAGADADWLAPLGNDFGDEFATVIAQAGLSLDQPRRPIPTVRNRIRYAADGSRRWQLLSSDDDFDRLSVYPGDVPAAALQADGLVLLAMTLRSQLTLTPWLREHSKATLYLDLREDYLDGNELALRDVATLCDVFLPSEIEALHLTRTSDARSALATLAGWGIDVVVIKCAERGCLVAADGVLSAVGTEAVQVVDSTGAGDAFCGAFAAVHLATGDPIAAARAANRIAALAVSGYGVTPLLDAVVGAR